jgi:hypothetical protein
MSDPRSKEQLLQQLLKFGDELQLCHKLIGDLRESLGLDGSYGADDNRSPSTRLRYLIREVKQKGIRKPLLF